jgi:uncharacterized protein (TIGR00375 family)
LGKASARAFESNEKLMIHIAADLHSHSGYAGGVGQISLQKITETMRWKGIDVFGTGDCLYPPRTEELKAQLKETAGGLFSLPNSQKHFLLQTEVIFTTCLKNYSHKIVAHHLILFPNFNCIYMMQRLMEKWKQKNTIGRPFIVTDTQKELEEKLFNIQDIDSLIEIIPAHVMTPDGVLGSKNNLHKMKEFYGSFPIHAIETGLSADPAMLEKISDLADLTMISNSDCHSEALNRIGREFTILKVNKLSYAEIIQAIRQNQVVCTAEFQPTEGRYYLTGHKKERCGHTKDIYFDNDAPTDLVCPVCGVKMHLGVKQRCRQLTDLNEPKIHRKFLSLIPLVEVIAHSLNMKSIHSKKVKELFNTILNVFPTEIALWQSSEVKELLDKRVPEKTINQIVAVQRGYFSFHPPGFDGKYGILHIGEKYGT